MQQQQNNEETKSSSQPAAINQYTAAHQKPESFIDILDNAARVFAQKIGIKTENHRRPVSRKKIEEVLEVDHAFLSSVMPYRYYWQETGLFVNAGSLGFALELTVLTGADEKLINAIADLLRFKLRDGYDMQITLWGSHQVGNLIDRALYKQTTRDDIYGDLARTSSRYYKKSAREFFKNKRGLPLTLRDYRLFCFVSKKVPTYSEKHADEIISQREDIEAEFQSADIGNARMNLESFLSVIRSWVNYDPNDIYYKSGRTNEHETLDGQIADRSMELRINTNNIEIEHDDNDSNRIKSRITNLSIKTLPDSFALWMAADNFCNVFRATKSIPCPFLITVNSRLISQVTARGRAQSRYLSMEKKAQSVYAKYISGTSQAAAEWKKIRDDLASDEIRLAESFFNLTLFSRDGEEKHNEAQAVACFKYNGIELFNINYMQMQSYLATLPFVLSEGMRDDLKKGRRLNTLTSWNLANLLPLTADFKVIDQGLLVPTFRNQIAYINPLDQRLPITNYNAIVAASPGSGKSFLVQALLNYVLSQNGICFVIDLGESYRKLCETVEGTYLDYSSLRLNPFTHLSDDEIDGKSEQIRDLFSILASPCGDLTDVQEEYLRIAIMDAWQKKKNDTIVDDIIDALETMNSKRETNDGRINDLITLLGKYSTNGAYPHIFNDCSELSGEAHFTVLELGALENKPDLMKAVLFALILTIEEQMYISSRDIPKMVVIEYPLN